MHSKQKITGRRKRRYRQSIGKDTAGGQVRRDCVLANSEQPGRFETFPRGMKYAVQEKGWIDSSKMLEWIDLVWRPICEGLQGHKLLVLDDYSCHQTAEVKRKLADLKTILVLVPGGYTGMLQPMDVGLMKPFKSNFANAFDDWQFDFAVNQSGGALPKADRTAISSFSLQAWEGLDAESIRNTWKHIGF